MTIFKKVFLLLVLSGLFLIEGINILQAAPSGSEIPLRLKTGMVTEAEFPEKIANVTKSVSSESLQIETLRNRMFLLPRENLDTQVYVITQDNISYCLHLIMDETKAVSRIKIEKSHQQTSDEQESGVVNTVELMKAILSGRQPSGSVSSRLTSPKEIFNDAKLRISISEIYEFPNNIKALCLTFENLTRKPLVVPIEHIELPGLLAISIDNQVLEPRPHDTKNKTSVHTAKAYMVVEGLNQ